MRIETQATPELSLVAKLIEEMNVAMLTTVGEQGALVSRPMAPVTMDQAGSFWFFTDIRSEKLDHLRQVNVAFSDEVKSTYVSLSGRGEVDTEPSRLEALWTPIAKAWFPDGPQSPHLALLKFVPASGEYWDAPGSRMVRLVSMAVSAVSGKAVGLGDHGTLEGLDAGQPLPRAKVQPL